MSSYVQAGWLLMTVRPQESDFDWLRRAVPWPLQRSHTHIYHDEDRTQIQGIQTHIQIHIQTASWPFKGSRTISKWPWAGWIWPARINDVCYYTCKQFSLQTHVEIRCGHIGYIFIKTCKKFLLLLLPLRLALKAGLIKKPSCKTLPVGLLSVKNINKTQDILYM